MGNMPDWFAKTPEMYASDKYFSLADANNDEAQLISRYELALRRFNSNSNDFANESDALDKEWQGQAGNIDNSLHHHFLGDWIHYLYYTDTSTYGRYGGAYWPPVGSQTVVDNLREGTRAAIYKALGYPAITNLPADLQVTQQYLDAIFQPEYANHISLDGVLGLATSWVCVAPAGTNFFEVSARRGAAIVELAIGTPKPYGSSPLTPVVERMVRSRGAFARPFRD